MSAYGPITQQSRSAIIPTLVLPWNDPQHLSATSRFISVHHVRLATTPSALLDVCYHEFHDELERGRTYPQEAPMSKTEFEAYFFGADVLIAIATDDPSPADLEASRNGRDWIASVVGFYYVKPNYPARSSHICNGGFVVCHTFRKLGVGSVLGKSFLHFAPRLGYKASVFNLVYQTNAASLRIWDGLGFSRVGVIPKAGRLRTADGKGEEFVDAIVVYKEFAETEEKVREGLSVISG